VGACVGSDDVGGTVVDGVGGVGDALGIEVGDGVGDALGIEVGDGVGDALGVVVGDDVGDVEL
jgi:hypothetical protein